MMLTQAQQDRILTQAVRRIMAALGDVRVVGGAVRDVMMGRDGGDHDLATPLPPQQVMALLAQNNIKPVPTGLAHGTITAVVDHVGYEITTLRRDVETDGRHARVAYTDDWRVDAARRDFTFNALYVDAQGALYDYFGGVDDARAGRVRFIGDAHARVREDVLRILRFFRFYAWFGKGQPDAAALEACRDLARLIPTLSAERVAREVLKLLAAPHPLAAWRLMMEAGAVAFIAPQATRVAYLEHVLSRETAQGEAPQALTRLAALLPPDEAVARALAERLKFSGRDKDTLVLLARLPAILEDLSLRPALHRYGVEACRAALFLGDGDLCASLAVIAAWENPSFPLKGEDIVAQGVEAGPRVGEWLRAVEQWWCDGDCRADRAACLAFLGTQIECGKNN